MVVNPWFVKKRMSTFMITNNSNLSATNEDDVSFVKYVTGVTLVEGCVSITIT